MARIIVEIDDSKAALLRKKAEKFGILPDQFVTASIEDLIGRPEPEFVSGSSLRLALSFEEIMYNYSHVVVIRNRISRE
jgi:hypothetical protein